MNLDTADTEMDTAIAIAPPDAPTRLIVDVDGFEGPLDLLLLLARRQKVDLAKISILALAEQYVGFVERVRETHLDLAAEYLVMAAWLAYLKSRLLLPAPADDGEDIDAREEARRLKWRLMRLQAMRAEAERLFARDRLGLDVFARGAPEGLHVERHAIYTDTLYELLTTYAEHRRANEPEIAFRPTVMRGVPIARAREWFANLFGVTVSWEMLETFLPKDENVPRRAALASAFVAALHMAHEGQLDIRQDTPFGTVYLRRGQQKMEEAA